MPVIARCYYVYLLTNERNWVLYTGVTNDLYRRVREHREKRCPGFTARYNVNKLVHFEVFADVSQALEREKQIKSGSRARKVELIRQHNPGWSDLFLTLSQQE